MEDHLGDHSEIRRSMQSVLIPVPAVDPLVERFRLDGDWSRRLGVPAHITLAGPFPLSTELPMERLAPVARSAAGMRFTLSEVSRIGDSICLLLADEEPLVKLRSELLKAVGAEPRADGEWPFHLTISRSESISVTTVREALEPSLPPKCEINLLTLALLREDELSLVAVKEAPTGIEPV